MSVSYLIHAYKCALSLTQMVSRARDPALTRNAPTEVVAVIGEPGSTSHPRRLAIQGSNTPRCTCPKETIGNFALRACTDARSFA